MKLFYILLGATPQGRNVEQHDVFFGIAETIKELYPAIREFWKEAGQTYHMDGYQEVKYADGYEVKIVPREKNPLLKQLYFVNLGGYKKGYFEEFHQQSLLVGFSMAEIVKKAKASTFYKTMGFPKAVSHIDEKYGVDIDDVFAVDDILPLAMKEKYSIILEPTDTKDQINFSKVGYIKINKK
ncbi:DUF1543 domain-containing protein [Chryseobacterium sp.]|uniref:DUF1543 domain-containing protein n=1 Tax=Chryseobacterium sp. TaxID=1871047 RepID=UPI00388F755D